MSFLCCELLTQEMKIVSESYKNNFNPKMQLSHSYVIGKEKLLKKLVIFSQNK